jgi:hypothetical protein
MVGGRRSGSAVTPRRRSQPQTPTWPTPPPPTHPTPNQVRELLQQLAESRLTAKQVLVHPWLTAHSI